MMNRPIEGTIAAATLRRRLLGHSFWSNVIVRRTDGSELRFARLTVADRLEDALAVGSSGRFHFHDMVGARGLHAFAPSKGGVPTQAFPRLIELVFAALAVLNLSIAAGWLGWAGLLSPVSLATGILATMVWATCRGARQAILHDLRYENRLAARRTHRTHRTAVMYSHA